MKRYYDLLKSTYPEYISLNQMYQICKIAKATARYLVQNKIIPCIENPNNKTWRYKIALDDVIDYLKKRDQYNDSMIPKGAIERKKYPSKKQALTLPPILTSSKNQVEAYFKKLYSSYPDVVTTNQAALMTGLSKKTITGLIKKGTLQAISHNRGYVVPKQWLMDFVTSDDYLTFRSSSEKFKSIIHGYGTKKKK